MSLKGMFAPMARSPVTELLEDINAEQDEIKVSNLDKLPMPPNVATIGRGDNTETVMYESKDIETNKITMVTRGWEPEGSAKAWEAGTPIARVMTASDLLFIQQWIVDNTDVVAITPDPDDPDAPDSDVDPDLDPTTLKTVTFHEVTNLENVSIKVFTDSDRTERTGLTVTTDIDGMATKNLPDGFYWFTAEHDTFPGDDCEGVFFIYGYDVYVRFEMGVALPGEAFAVTLNETNGLEGVMLAVYKDQYHGECVRVGLVSDNNGNVVTNLDTGNYWFVGYVSPDLYDDNYQIYYGDFEVEATNITVEYAMEAIVSTRLVSIASGSSVFRFPRELGEHELWEYDAGSSVNQVCCDDEGNTYACCDNGTVHKIDSDGLEVWVYDGASSEDRPKVHGVAVASDGNVFAITRTRVHKLNGSDGTHQWRQSVHDDAVTHFSINVGNGPETIPTQYVYVGYYAERTVSGSIKTSHRMIRFRISASSPGGGSQLFSREPYAYDPVSRRLAYIARWGSEYCIAPGSAHAYLYTGSTEKQCNPGVGTHRDIARLSRFRFVVGGSGPTNTNNAPGAQVLDVIDGGFGYKYGSRFADGGECHGIATNPEGWIYAGSSKLGGRVRCRKPDNTVLETKGLGGTVRGIAVACGTFESHPVNWGYTR